MNLKNEKNLIRETYKSHSLWHFRKQLVHGVPLSNVDGNFSDSRDKQLTRDEASIATCRPRAQ